MTGVDGAKALAAMLRRAGAHAIKFQIVDPDRLVADRKQHVQLPGSRRS